MSLSSSWTQADTYEPYVGRWSRRIALEFLEWLVPAQGIDWLDVGCGTGALAQTVIQRCAPRRVVGVDRSTGYLGGARARSGPAADFVAGDAGALPVVADHFDCAVSALVLNFVSEPARMVAEMTRAVRPSGLVALYVWDYAHRMELMRWFWDAATELDPYAAEQDEGNRFTICGPDPLRSLFVCAGLADVEVRPIDVPTVFRDFDDYWTPFLGGQGPAPGYVKSLDERRRIELRELLRTRLPRNYDGSIPLAARAWAVRGRVVA